MPGTCCHWKSFEGVIPKLSENFYVLCVSYDGFEETEHSAFVSMQDEAEKIEACIKENLNGEIRDDRAVRAGNVSTCVFHQVASLPSGLPYITMP